MQDPNTQPSTDASAPTPEVTPAPSPETAPAPSAPEVTPAPGVTPVVPPVPAPEPTTFGAAPTPTLGTQSADTQVGQATAPAAAAHVPGSKNHLVAVLLSIFVGSLGVDRFYLGHIGLGVAKLLLSWLTFGIWWLVDVILVATRRVKNVTWEN